MDMHQYYESATLFGFFEVGESIECGVMSPSTCIYETGHTLAHFGA